MAEISKVMAKWGFVSTKRHSAWLIRDYILQNGMVTPFKNNIPGNDWFTNFI